MFCFSRGIEVRVLCEYVHNANKFPAYIWGHLETPRIELNVSQLKRLSNNAFTSQGLSAKSIKDLGLRTKKTKSSLPRGFFFGELFGTSLCNFSTVNQPLQVQMEEVSMSNFVASQRQSQKFMSCGSSTMPKKLFKLRR